MNHQTHRTTLIINGRIVTITHYSSGTLSSGSKRIAVNSICQKNRNVIVPVSDSINESIEAYLFNRFHAEAVL